MSFTTNTTTATIPPSPSHLLASQSQKRSRYYLRSYGDNNSNSDDDDDDSSFHPEEEDEQDDDDFDDDESHAYDDDETVGKAKLGGTTLPFLVIIYLILLYWFSAPFYNHHHHDKSTTQDSWQTIQALSHKIQNDIPHFAQRAEKVKFGGTQPWWQRKLNHKHAPIYTHDKRLLIPGGKLIDSYQRHGKFDSNIPFMVQSTLAWRENFHPWKVNQQVIKQNAKGWIYTRGRAKKTEDAMIWIRAEGKETALNNNDALVRTIVQTMDMALSQALRHGGQRVNAVADVRKYNWQKLVQNVVYIYEFVQLYYILSSHYPRRLSGLYLIVQEKDSFAWRVLAPWLEMVLWRLLDENDDKNNKVIHVIAAQDQSDVATQLQAIVPLKRIPAWLGGNDRYRFQAQRYYFGPCHSFTMMKTKRAARGAPTTADLVERLSLLGHYLN